jgi:hypothetical protein
MRQTDKERIKEIFESAVDKLDRSAAYDAIAFAERDETDPEARQLLHEAALELMRSHHDKSHLDKVRQLLESIVPEP